MSRVPVNPFALGAAFVERAVELGWVQVDSDGRRSSYYLTDSGNEGLENFGVKIEKAMHFTIIPERDTSAPKRRASSSMQARRGPSHAPSHRPAHGGGISSHGRPGHGGRHGGPHKGHGHVEHHVRHDRYEGHERHGGHGHHEANVSHGRHGESRKRTLR